MGRQPLEAPMLFDQLDLRLGRWLLVLEDASRWLTSALVEEGEGFRRARAGDGIAEELLARAVTGRGSERSTFRRLGAVAPWKGERPIEVDQSNESIVVGARPS
jgi:maltokinase